MADKDNSGSAPQSTFVTTKLFWIVAVILAIGLGVVFFIEEQHLTAARDDFDKTVKATKDQLAKDTDEKVTAAKSALMQEVAKLQEDNKKLATEKDALKASLSTLTENYTKFVTSEFKEFRSKAETQLSESKSALVQQGNDVHRIDVDVKYLKESVDTMKSKLEGLDKDIGSLTTGSAELKKEQAALKAEITSVSTSGKVTYDQLETLKNKTREFELKIMAEHARQAAKALKTGDTSSWFEALDIKN